MGFRISDLQSASLPLTGSELVELEQAGGSRKVAVSELMPGSNEGVLFIRVADYPSADEAAAVAYERGACLVLLPGEEAKIICNPSSGDSLSEIAKWYGQCLISPDATMYIQLADGAHTVSEYVDVPNGNGSTLDIRGSAAPNFYQISSVSFAAVSGSLYTATVTVTSALDSAAVVGGPIGIQNAQGSNDVQVINGGQIIKSIAADRLSFTFDFYSPAGLPVTGVLDNTLTYGLVANQVVVPRASLICQNTGWDGSSREGFINAIDGGRVTMRNFGLAYSGAGSTEHDMLFARGAGSRIYLYDRMVISGAGDKVLRSYGGAEIFGNRSCIGGAGKALELFQGVAGGNNQFVRCSTGGALTAGFTCGHASTVNFAQGTLWGCGIGLRTTTEGASISAYPARIGKCNEAMLATQGSISGTTETVIERCTLGVNWAGGGEVVGNFTMGTAGQANTSDSVRPGNTEYNGGRWYQDTAKNTERENQTIRSSVPYTDYVDGATTCRVDGDGGHLNLQTHSTSRNINFKTATTTLWSMSGANGGAMTPGQDNTRAIGSAGLRCSEIYAGNGAINTSDAREKTEVRQMTASELRVAKALASEIGIYQFLASIEDKGEGARLHVGLTVQRAIELFQEAGLDPTRYGFVCHDEWGEEWSEETKEDGSVSRVLIHGPGDRYGFRYEQLALFIMRGIEHRMKALEATILGAEA